MNKPKTAPKININLKKAVERLQKQGINVQLIKRPNFNNLSKKV